jgi:hypothetical protein
MSLHAVCLLASLLSSAAVKDFEGLTVRFDDLQLSLILI